MERLKLVKRREIFRTGLKTEDFSELIDSTLVFKSFRFMKVSVLSLLILGIIVLVLFIVPFLTSWFWFLFSLG